MLRRWAPGGALLVLFGLFFPTVAWASPGCSAINSGVLNGTATFAGPGNPTDTGTVETINTTPFLSDRATTLAFNSGDVVNFTLTISANMYGYFRYNTPGANFNPSSNNTTSGSYSQTLPSGVTKVYIFSGRTDTNDNGTIVASATCAPVLPSVTGISPTTGTTAGGTSVVITGTSFTDATAVTFGGTAASFTVNSDTQITATSPAHAAGTVDVVVTNGTGPSTTTAADRFTYATPVPTVGTITPNSGSTAGGTGVTITGSNFVGGSTTVTIGGVAATGVSVTNSSTLTATTPAYVSGSLTKDVVVNNGSGTATLTNGFTYTLAAPTIGSITPNSGSTSGGTSVTVSGTNFVPGTTLTIGGISATGVSVTNGTTLTATTPAYVSGSLVKDVVVNNGAGSATLTNGYTYSASAPTVTSVSPNTGPAAGGTRVTIAGTNLSGATSVKFGAAAATITSNTATQIVAVSPAGTGTVDITVTTSAGTSSTSAADQFTYASSGPTVTSISPSTGPASGGTSVTITGTNLGSATSVKFGTAAATITSNTATQIVAVSPAGTGTVDVVVVTSGGTSSASSATRFVYGAPADSQKAQQVQKVITKMVATSSGQVISSSVDTAIADAFADGGSNPVNIGANGVRINFAAESPGDRRVDDAFRTLAMAVNPKRQAQLRAEKDWNLWLDIRGTGWKVRDTTPSASGGSDLTGSQLNITGGLSRKLNSDTLVGIIVGHELFKYDVVSLGGGLKGTGETLGSYFSRRFDRVRFDVTLAYSLMSYDVSAGTANGSLKGSRWLFSTGVTGNQRIGEYLLEPSLKVFSLWERQNDWTDSLGTIQDARNFSAGRASGGTKISRGFDSLAGKLSPFIGLYGDYYFESDNSVSAGQPVVGIQSGWSARVTSGVSYIAPNGPSFGVSAELGGLGANFLMWSGQIRASVPF